MEHIFHLHLVIISFLPNSWASKATYCLEDNIVTFWASLSYIIRTLFHPKGGKKVKPTLEGGLCKPL